MGGSRSRRVRVAVLMGGPSSERDVSLASGGAVLRALDPARYEVTRLEITSDGRWLPAGAAPGTGGSASSPSALVPLEAERALAPSDAGGPPFDVAFLALHGAFGEDGTVQGLLEAAGIPYTGSGVLASALAMDKPRAKLVVASVGVRVARGSLVDRTAFARDPQHALDSVVASPGLPAFVKPASGGSSIGAGLASTRAEVLARLTEVFARHDERAVVEERLVGVEVTCAVLGNRGQRARALPPVEIVPKSSEFFDYRAKYDPGASDEICPARLPPREFEAVERAALAAHQALGCDGMSRSDFIVVDGEPVYLETNTIPGMTAVSLCPKAARAVGIDFPALLDRIVAMALDRAAARTRAAAPAATARRSST